MAQSTADNDEPVSVMLGAAVPTGLRIPPAPPRMPAVWLRPGETTRLAGFEIPDGMLYLQTGLPNPANRQFGVIETDLPVSNYDVDYKREVPRCVGYWQLHPDQRRQFLTWLSAGRPMPVPLGFAYMFLFGLEHRVLVDTMKTSPQRSAALEDLPRIREACVSLASSFSRDSRFASAVAGLIDVVSLLSAQDGLLRVKPVPYFPPRPALPCYLRLALGQCARDHVRVPVDLALAWALTSPGLSSRRAITRCRTQFVRLFTHGYATQFGAGLELPKGKGFVQLGYRPSSPSLPDKTIERTFDDTPEVSSHRGAHYRLTALAEITADALDAFSRRVATRPSSAADADLMLMLPLEAWEPKALTGLHELQQRAGAGPLTLTLRELLATFANPHALSREGYSAMAQVLGTRGLSLEPTAPNKRTRDLDSIVVVFQTSVPLHADRAGQLYKLGYGHDIAAASSAVVMQAQPKPPMQLDEGLIAQVQKDTHEVAALLASIFVDETPAPAAANTSTHGAHPAADGRLSGLDRAHTKFVAVLVSRPEWSRQELQAIATTLGLMLDGAVEAVNDAAFEAHDQPLVEGDDPVCINQELLL